MKKLARIGGYIFASLIILFALLASGLELFSPVLDQHRSDFEKWASQYLGVPVTLGKVELSWYQYQPVLNFKRVSLLNQTDHAPILHVRKLGILISIPQSLWHFKPVLKGLMIRGSTLHLTQSVSGDWSVLEFSSFKTDEHLGPASSFKELVALTTTIPYLLFNNINITYQGKTGQPQHIILNSLRFKNRALHHAIRARIVVQQDLPIEINLATQWRGDITDSNSISAELYAYVSNVTLPEWLQGREYEGWKVEQGIGNAKIWASWDRGQLQRIQTNLQLHDLTLFSKEDQSRHSISYLRGNLGWKQENGIQVFAGDDILIDLPDHLWPVTHFYVSLKPNTEGHLSLQTAHFGYINLKDIQSFLLASSLPWSATLRNDLAGMHLTGHALNANLAFLKSPNSMQDVSFETGFSQVSTTPWREWPGVKNLTGTLKWDGSKGQLILNSQRVLFTYGSLFTRPLLLDQLSSHLLIEQDKNKIWMLRMPELRVLTEEGSGNASGTLVFPLHSSPVIDLDANFSLQKAEGIAHYLPMQVFDADLRQWLKNAFLAGEVKSGQIKLKGALADFPFDHANGTFFITGKVNNVDLNYAPSWPYLKNIVGELTFSGRNLAIEVNQARILDINLSKVHANIPSLGDSKQPLLLNVQGENIAVDLSQGLRFIKASPLRNVLDKFVQHVTTSGPSVLRLGLTIPLKQPDQLKVNGEVITTDAKLNWLPWHLSFKDIHGPWRFTERGVESKELEATFLNKKFTVSLATLTNKVQARFSYPLSLADIKKELKISVPAMLSGKTSVDISADFSLNSPLHLHFDTDLLGIKVDLPPPYGKTSVEKKLFTSDVFISDTEPLRLQLSYGGQISAALILQKQKEVLELKAANISLGSGRASWPNSGGLYFTGELKQLNWEEIKSYIDQSHSAYPDLSSLSLRRIDIRIGNLMVFNQLLSAVRLQVIPTKDNWNILVNSAEVDGRLQVPVRFKPKERLRAWFSKLYLRKQADIGKLPAINVKMLPILDVMVDNLRYNDMRLGRLIFKTLPGARGLTIQTFSLVTPSLNLQASGEWTQSNHTRLQGIAVSSQINSLLNDLGVNADNFIASKGKLGFNLQWQGSPFAASFAVINGGGSLHMEKGRIINIEQAGGAKADIGRMLSVFSLQNIPRRLTFDFSDVFQKGYSFDSVDGNFNFVKGSIFTDDLQFNGPLAKVGIHGRIGMAYKDFDFLLSVTPYVTASSLPLAATLISGGNPLVGLAATAVSSVVGSGVSKVATYYYNVKGPWSHPVWEAAQSSRKR